jgi:hypothetical protein
MRVMMIVKASPESEAGMMPSEALMAAMAQYNEELQKAGVLVDLTGLKPTSAGGRVKFSGGKKMWVDGPFAETKELVAGFWIINVKSFEEAKQWALKAPQPHENQDCHIEVRPYFSMEDFGESPAVERQREVGRKLESQK